MHRIYPICAAMASLATARPGKMFDANGDGVDARAFIERCQNNRHYFRFIVAPDDAMELYDLRAFTRDLMGDVACDLGTKLDWVAIDHWNTEHPHIHVLLRGRVDDGADSSSVATTSAVAFAPAPSSSSLWSSAHAASRRFVSRSNGRSTPIDGRPSIRRWRAKPRSGMVSLTSGRTGSGERRGTKPTRWTGAEAGEARSRRPRRRGTMDHADEAESVPSQAWRTRRYHQADSSRPSPARR